MKKLYKSLFSIAAIALGSAGAVDAQCTWTLDMTDSWGDGWNGNEIEVSINGVPTNYTLSGGSSGSQGFTVNDNDSIAITYLGGGSFNSEVGFSITDNNGNLLTSASSGPSAGNVYWHGISQCASACPMPSDLMLNCSTGSELSLSWTMNGSETAWEIEYGPTATSFGGGSSMVITTGDVTMNGSTVTYNLGGLNPSTSYDIYLAADCGGSVYTHYAIGSFSTTGGCPDVTGLNGTFVDNDSVIVVWDAGCIESSWNIELGDQGFTPGNGDEIYANTITDGTTDTIGSLMQITDYDVYVQSDCGGGSTGTWVGPYSFTSLPNCAAPTGFIATVISPDSVDLAWTPGSTGETEWTIEYGPSGFTQGNGTYVSVNGSPNDTIGSLMQNTTYDFYLLGNCSAADSSLWVGPETVTTPLFCGNVSGLSATTVTDTAFLSWTGGVDGETEWNVEYGPAGFTLGNGTMYTTTNNGPDTLVGLSPSAVYDFYVQASCASGDTSLYTGPFTFAMPLGNDDACDAMELPVDGVGRWFTSTGSTSQTGEPQNSSGGSSTWFYYIPTNDFGTTVSLCGSNFDTKVYGFSFDDCSDFSTYTELNYNDDACGLQSEIEVCGAAGDTIMVKVDGFSGASGNFLITITGNDFEAGNDGTASVCVGDTLDLWTQLSGNNGTNGTWAYPNNPNAVFDDSLAVTANMTAASNEYYYIDGNSCAADTATITINALEPGNTGTAISPFTACNSDVFLPDGLEGTVEAGGTWTDDSGTGLLAGPNNNVFVAAGVPAGTYPFTYTVDNGICPAASTTVTVTITDCSGIAENNFEVSLYPNPNNGNFFLLSEMSGESTVTITDVSGKVVYNNVVGLTTGTPFEVSLNNVEAGIYMINVSNASGSKVMNMIIK
ncbi:T9SS type A sorting domain-containing protein [Parvicella tangerina]|uniref:Fibronectin type-III domain-containing protein n=1 Tax=Parvicella tangerina TaxID=2829795 RepID=A0A916JPV1_9FLAO|nr:T9SS type A sorting domain-containing protein [Parvicella tangerina]CAG5086347.1 hypothetical protein CRYO30217_03090 [Parvicella tangerina]